MRKLLSKPPGTLHKYDNGMILCSGGLDTKSNELLQVARLAIQQKYTAKRKTLGLPRVRIRSP